VVRRASLRIGVIGVVCALAVILCGGIGTACIAQAIRLGEAAAASNGPSDGIEALFRVGYVLDLGAAVAAAGVIVATIAILVLLSRRWQLRPARAR
jgi:hypothetical protein